MSGCLTKAAIVDKLSQIETLFVRFLAGDINSVTLQADVTAILDACKDDEYNDGNYSTRQVCVVPDETCPLITLNLLYVAAVPGSFPVECSKKECFAVSITYLPHPNGLQALVLTPQTDTLYKDGRVTGGYGVCSAITAYNHTKQKDCDDLTTETLVICGGSIDNCGPKDCLDFLSFLCNKLNFDFSIRRDRCGKLWLVTMEWDVEDYPFDHKECETVKETEVCTYYINYEKLRHYYEKKSCFRFDKCDPAELAYKTKYYEILFFCIDGELVATYITDDYMKLPQFFREIAECCNFVCEPIAPASTARLVLEEGSEEEGAEVSSSHGPLVTKISGDAGEICFGNYHCVRKLYCCKRKEKCGYDKYEKHDKYESDHHDKYDDHCKYDKYDHHDKKYY